MPTALRLMHRFFVSPDVLQADPVILDGDLAHQMSRVLRMQPGEHVILLDDSGWAYETEIQRISGSNVVARVLAKEWPQTETALRVTLFQAMTREKRMDWVLQKGTEIGVSTFVPMTTSRTMVSEPERVSQRRHQRWIRIVTEAAEQSGRTRIPSLQTLTSFGQACTQAAESDLGLLACLDEHTIPLRHAIEQALPNFAGVSLFIGPEGGFSPEEIALARGAGLQTVSLGPRTLRTETAGVAAVSAILYAVGELGG